MNEKLIKNVLFTIGILFVLSACNNQGTPAQNAPTPPKVDVAKPLKKMITEWDEYTGRFQPLEEVQIRARVSGYLDKVLFADGEQVKKGQTLFIIDQRPFKIALDSAQAQYELASKSFKRVEALRKSGAISEEDLDQRLQELRVAKSTLDSAKLNLEFTEVKSPINGRASRDLVNVGNLINGGEQNATLLTTVVSLDPIHFYFEVSESELIRYLKLDRSGSRANARNSSIPVFAKLQGEDSFHYPGKIDFVDNRVDNNTGTINARAIFDNKNTLIQPGIFGRMRLLGRSNFEALLVPDSAIGTDQSRKFVLVVNDDGIAFRKEVRVGRLYSKTLRVIESGLDQDDTLIVAGIQRIRGETKVDANTIQLTEPVGAFNPSLPNSPESVQADQVPAKQPNSQTPDSPKTLKDKNGL